ncbi:MAG: CaiB/BaiF CoA-transferase family protein, partial [Pseudomonadota bacterium]|nr:CaiB/BaiF CoA-transferase family protein [Pseudomonadota bacterium]
CAQGILMALLDRERTGEGRWIQSSLLQAQVALLDFQAARWLIDGVVPGQAGNDHPTSTPMGVYPTADGAMNIAATGDRMWRDFCKVIGRPDLPENPDYATPRDRLANRPALNGLIREITVTRTAAEWTEALLAAGIPCGPINAIDEVFADPQVVHLGLVGEVAHPTRGPLKVLNQPIQVSGAEASLRVATPEAGEHTDEVLEALGLGAEEIAALKAAGVV